MIAFRLDVEPRSGLVAVLPIKSESRFDRVQHDFAAAEGGGTLFREPQQGGSVPLTLQIRPDRDQAKRGARIAEHIDP